MPQYYRLIVFVNATFQTLTIDIEVFTMDIFEAFLYHILFQMHKSNVSVFYT